MVREIRGSVLEDEPRFRKFEVQNFQVHSNTKWKIYPFFDILRSKNLWFEVRSSVSEDEPRFGRFNVRFS